MDRFPLGYNTYSIRALRWNDLQLIEYASSLKLDAIFLQDSIDPGTNDPAHWKAVKDAAARRSAYFFMNWASHTGRIAGGRPVMGLMKAASGGQISRALARMAWKSTTPSPRGTHCTAMPPRDS